MESVALRLKALRNSAVPKVSSRLLAGMLEMHPSTYAAYEDPKKYKKPILPFDLAQNIARALASRGIEPAHVMELAGLTGELSAPAYASEDARWLPLSGIVAAGVWRSQSSLESEDVYEIEVGPPPYRGAERFVVRMEGQSMDLTVPPGADLECLRVPFSEVEPRAGDLVVVERTAHELTELTCKRLDRSADGWLLRAESSRPEFQEPIAIKAMEDASGTDEVIRVIGIVLKAHLDLAPRSLSSRRRRHG